MKIGVIVHSFTGNTLLAAEKIAEALKSAGHTPVIEKIKIQGGETADTKQFVLENPPDVSPYDALVFGAPVRAFSLSPVMTAYLNQLPDLNGRKVACFVTKQFANNWTGGKGAVSSMQKLCISKGGNAAGTGIVFWSKNRDRMIEDLAQSFAALF
jgi:NAD(P)H dehydrogenase (quinone)